MDTELLAALVELMANRNFFATPKKPLQIPRPSPASGALPAVAASAPASRPVEEEPQMSTADDVRNFFSGAVRFVPA